MAKLQRGDWAPEIETFDIRGIPVDTKSLGEYGMWIAFYRYASCPMCNQHFDDVVGQQERLITNGVMFVSIFESELANFPNNIRSRNYSNVRVVADPAKRFYDLYGVERSWGKLFTPESAIARVKAGLAGYMEKKIDGPLDRIPAHFLVLPGGIVHQARYGRSAADHVKWRDLDDFFEAVRGARSQVNRPLPATDVGDRTEFVEKTEIDERTKIDE